MPKTPVQSKQKFWNIRRGSFGNLFNGLEQWRFLLHKSLVNGRCQVGTRVSGHSGHSCCRSSGGAGGGILPPMRLLIALGAGAGAGAGAAEEEPRSGGAGLLDPEALPESGGASIASSTGMILSPAVVAPP